MHVIQSGKGKLNSSAHSFILVKAKQFPIDSPSNNSFSDDNEISPGRDCLNSDTDNDVLKDDDEINVDTDSLDSDTDDSYHRRWLSPSR